MKNFLDYHIFDSSRTSANKTIYFGFFGKSAYPKNFNKEPILRISNSLDPHDDKNCFYININSNVILGETNIQERELDILLDWANSNKTILNNFLKSLLKGLSGELILEKLILK